MSETTSDGLNGWGKTLDSASGMAEGLRTNGWEVVTVRAAHVAPESPADGDTDRFGFVYLAQGEVADALENVIHHGEFDSYEVFNRSVGTDLFTLTRVTDGKQQVAVLLVGAVDLTDAGDLAAAAADREEMYSHVRLLDGTHLGSFHHDDPTPFFPDRL